MDKKFSCLLSLSSVVIAASAWCGATEPAIVPAKAPPPSTYCRYVPERADDFAWENDLVAFRAYGPALSKGSENSGIDCWAKRVPYPVIDKWYRLDREQKLSYHEDRGEGCDFYHVGKTRGCGGTALWVDGAMVLSGVYKQWKILETGPQKSAFQLTYEYSLGTRRIHELKTITIELGRRLFKSESVFTENEKPVADLEIAVGLSTQNRRGVATLSKETGTMSVWFDYGKHGLGTGVVMDPRRITGMQEIRIERRDESHAVLTCRTDATGRTVHYAGFAWTKAGGVASSAQWQVYLTQFAATIQTPAAK